MTTSTTPQVVLVIEASTAKGSVALFGGRELRQRRDVPMGASRDDALFPAIQEVLQSESLSPSDINAIVCGSGPGSFTSLRIAGALAKGLAHATGARLFAVSSLLLSAAAYSAASRNAPLSDAPSSDAPSPDAPLSDAPSRTSAPRELPVQVVVHSDALRGERYTLVVNIDQEGHVEAIGDLGRLDESALASFAGGRVLLSVLGDAESPREFPVVPDAGALMHVRQWDASGGVDLNSWEPAYGRLAEAQVKWEAAHHQPLPAS